MKINPWDKVRKYFSGGLVVEKPSMHTVIKDNFGGINWGMSSHVLGGISQQQEQSAQAILQVQQNQYNLWQAQGQQQQSQLTASQLQNAAQAAMQQGYQQQNLYMHQQQINSLYQHIQQQQSSMVQQMWNVTPPETKEQKAKREFSDKFDTEINDILKES